MGLIGCHRIGSIGQNQLWKCVISIDFVLAFSFHYPFHFHSVQSHNAIVFAPSSAFFKSRELFLSDQEWDNCWHAKMTCNAVHTGTSGERQHWQLRESMQWKNWAIWVKMDRNLEPAIHTLSDDWSRPWNVLRWEKQCHLGTIVTTCTRWPKQVVW